MFVDTAQIHVSAGNGGNGLVSWRREKFVARGGPNGGNGGNGGSVIFQASESDRSLVRFRRQKQIRAKSGGDGRPGCLHGKNGVDEIVAVPVGTIVRPADTDQAWGDLDKPGERLVVARGGIGGFGNAHFKSSRRQAPAVSEKGTLGQEFDLSLELKLLADVGIVGAPNAGKSSLLRAISQARPRVADYPFTTLEPHLGVAEFDQTAILFADIPGLIAGAHKGRGLGHQFLRHLERNRLIVHLIDASRSDLVTVYRQINRELQAYSRRLADLAQVIVLNKVDLVGANKIDRARQRLATAAAITPEAILSVSALAKIGLVEFRRQVRQCLDQVPPAPVIETTAVPLPEISGRFQVRQTTGGDFIISGAKIEHFAAKTRFDQFAGRQRLADIVVKLGIRRELDRQGYSDQRLIFGDPEIGRLESLTGLN